MLYGYKDFINLPFTTIFSKNNAFIHFVIHIFNLNYNIRLWCLIIKHWVWFLPSFWVRHHTEKWPNFFTTFHFVFALFLFSSDCCLVEKTENSELTWLNSSIVLLQHCMESILYSTAQTQTLPSAHWEELDPQIISKQYQFSFPHTFKSTSIQIVHTHLFLPDF